MERTEGVRMSVDEVCGVESSTVNDQRQHVGPAVVAGRVEVVPLLPYPLHVDVGAHQPLLAGDGRDHPLPVGAGDAGAAVVDEPVGIAPVVGDDARP